MKQRIVLLLLVSSLLFVQILYVTPFSDSVYGQTSETDWWPMFQHDPAHTGSSSSIVPETNETLWIFNIDRIHSVGFAPSVDYGRVLVGSGSKLWCINSSSGVELWNYTNVNLEFSNSPVVSKNKVIISGEQNLYCFNAENGNLIWNFTAKSRLRSSPAIDKGRVFVGAEERPHLYCLNETNGNLLWNYNWRTSITASPTVIDDRVFVTSEDGTLHCIDVIFGQQLWTYTLSGGGDSPSAAYYEGKILVGTSHGNNTLYCLNSISGELIWKYNTEGWISATPAIAYDKVFIGDRGNTARVYCLNITDGSLIWKKSYEGEYGAEYSSPVVADGKIILCMGKNLYVLNETDGEIVWSYDPPLRRSGSSYSNGFWGKSVALAEGRIYVASDEYSLYCFGPMLYYDITVDPQYLNNKGNLFTPLPTSCTFEFSNETEKNASTPTSFRAPLGTFSLNNVTWNGYEVLTFAKRTSIYLDSDLLWRPQVNCTLPTITSLSLSSSTSSVGFKTNVNGRLTCNKEGVSYAPILLSYSVTDGETWNELTQAHTSSNGEYSAIWMPTVSGRYIVKAIWSGNTTFPKSSIQTYLVVLPVQEQNIISVTSNAKVSNLIYNNTNNELRFIITESSESVGYSDVFIPKTIVGNIEGTDVFLDGKKIDHTYSSLEDSWLIHFNYIPNAYEVTISLAGTTNLFEILINDLLPILLVLSVIILCVIIFYFSRRKK